MNRQEFPFAGPISFIYLYIGETKLYLMPVCRKNTYIVLFNLLAYIDNTYMKTPTKNAGTKST